MSPRHHGECDFPRFTIRGLLARLMQLVDNPRKIYKIGSGADASKDRRQHCCANHAEKESPGCSDPSGYLNTELRRIALLLVPYCNTEEPLSALAGFTLLLIPSTYPIRKMSTRFVSHNTGIIRHKPLQSRCQLVYMSHTKIQNRKDASEVMPVHP
jgi:hypothetical protein